MIFNYVNYAKQYNLNNIQHAVFMILIKFAKNYL